VDGWTYTDLETARKRYSIACSTRFDGSGKVKIADGASDAF